MFSASNHCFPRRLLGIKLLAVHFSLYVMTKASPQPNDLLHFGTRYGKK
jgi:hypothetical protein